MKERLGAETLARQETENKLAVLKNELAFYQHLNIFGPAEFMQNSKDELEQLYNARIHMDQTVNDLRRQRDIIIGEIER